MNILVFSRRQLASATNIFGFQSDMKALKAGPVVLIFTQSVHPLRSKKYAHWRPSRKMNAHKNITTACLTGQFGIFKDSPSPLKKINKSVVIATTLRAPPCHNHFLLVSNQDVIAWRLARTFLKFTQKAFPLWRKCVPIQSSLTFCIKWNKVCSSRINGICSSSSNVMHSLPEMCGSRATWWS